MYVTTATWRQPNCSKKIIIIIINTVALFVIKWRQRAPPIIRRNSYDPFILPHSRGVGENRWPFPAAACPPPTPPSPPPPPPSCMEVWSVFGPWLPHCRVFHANELLQGEHFIPTSLQLLQHHHHHFHQAWHHFRFIINVFLVITGRITFQTINRRGQ